MQLAVASAIVKQDGFGALYRGLSAGLLRQATYTTARLGIFQGLSDYLKKANDGKARALHLTQPCNTGLCDCGFLCSMLTMTQSHSSCCAHWRPSPSNWSKAKAQGMQSRGMLPVQALPALAEGGCRAHSWWAGCTGWVPCRSHAHSGCRQTLRCPRPAGGTTRAWVTPWLVSLILAHAASTFGQSAPCAQNSRFS